MGKKKILFIEDEPDQIEMIKIRLEPIGYEFIYAVDGEEGINKAKQEQPDLILLDLLLPRIDGYDVCKRLKEGSDTKNIPIIIITAYVVKDLEEKCLACGADDVIRKPYESKALVEKIKKNLEELK